MLSYTLEELYYEFRDKIEREKAADEMLEQEADKIEQKKIDDALAWAEEEEAKELQRMKEAESVADNNTSWKPSEEEKKWMEQEIKRAKEIYGEDFGENIDEVF